MFTAKFYKSIIETSLDGFWIVDKQGTIVEVNQAYCDMSGYTREEFLQLDIADIELLDTPEIIEQRIEKISTYGSDSFETKHKKKDGATIDVEVTATLNSELGMMVVVIRDITDQKKLQESLKEKQAALNTAQRIAHIGHWELDLIKNELYWSDEVYRIFGLKPQEFGATYEAFLHYIHPDDHELVNQAYAQSIADLSPYQITHRVVTKNKEIKYVEERCEHIIQNGEVIKSIGTVLDITEKKEQEKKIQEYITLIDEEVITSSTDLEGDITYVSNAFCKISGYNREELIGRNHNIVRHPDMQESVYTTMWQTIKSGGVWSGEIKNLKKDGGFYWVEAKISPIYNVEGTKIGYTAIRHDITDKKRIELISITDGLTGIYNRRHFNHIFDEVINRAKRENRWVNFLIMDIDHFKQYNDTYGHQMGDDVLKKVATALKGSLRRADDYCFRLGGEEFGILFNAKDAELAYSFAETVRSSIEELHIKHEKNTASAYITASMGLIAMPAEKISDMDEVYRKADELLYYAKEHGRNQVAANSS